MFSAMFLSNHFCQIIKVRDALQKLLKCLRSERCKAFFVFPTLVSKGQRNVDLIDSNEYLVVEFGFRSHVGSS